MFLFFQNNYVKINKNLTFVLLFRKYKLKVTFFYFLTFLLVFLQLFQKSDILYKTKRFLLQDIISYSRKELYYEKNMELTRT